MRRYSLIVITLIIVALVSFYYFFLSGNTNTNYSLKNQTVVAFGDSLVEGVGATPGNDFVSQVGRTLQINIKNVGRSGDTTESALARIDNVLQSDPGVLLLLLGGNDVLRRIPKEETFKNLETIIEKFKANGTLVVLLGVRGGILSDEYEDDFEDLAEKHNLPYVSNVLKNIILDNSLMSDTIHPNDAGYKVIAGRVSAILTDILK